MELLADSFISLWENFSWIWENITNLGEKFRKIPWVISYYTNLKEQTINNIPELNESNFRFYVWRTLKSEKNQLYSQDFYVWAIENLLKNTSNNSIIHIEIWAELKNIINDDQVGESEKMSVSEQILYINNIIENNFSKNSDKIKVNDLSKSHSELFSYLKSSWVEVKSKEITLEKDNINSLEIYKLLFNAVNEDEVLFKNVKATIPLRLRNESTKQKWINNWNYYWLVEIAIRLTDYIKWIHIQWWENRQRKYDKIISDILSWNYNYIPTIINIYDFIKQNNINYSFDSIYLDKRKYEKELQRESWLKKIKNQIWAISLALSLAIWSWIWWVNYIQNRQEAALQSKIDAYIVELSTQMPEFIDFTDAFMRMVWWLKYDKLTFSRWNSEVLAKRFLSIYWNWDEESFMKIQQMILESMKNAHDFFKIHTYLLPTNWYDDFLKDEFIKNKKWTLISMWYNIEKWLWDFNDYKDIIEKSAVLSDDDAKKIKFSDFSVYHKTRYHSYYLEYEVWIVWYSWQSWDFLAKSYWQDMNSKFLVARRIWASGIAIDDDFSIENWIRVSKELLKLL